MSSMEEALIEAGFRVANVGYSSRLLQIEQLAGPAINQGFSDCEPSVEDNVHFVTHSLGGILLRYYLSQDDQTEVRNYLGNVVMLGPPNQGSEVVDALKDLPGYSWLNGPAGYQLGTGPESLPLSLPAVDFSLGVIAGSQSIDPISSYFLPDPDDGKVSVASTRVDGMREHIVLPVTHTFMMSNEEVQKLVIHYLKNGTFVQSDQ